uniref:Ionotropic glutamate receptor L-glutamate and glycine-binding domain-containing protein n=1 Tax=Plectus sambesii TaxID=2011161 RepID=A0A914WRY8_9BILA
MAARPVVRLGYVRTTYPVLNQCALKTNWTNICKLPGIAVEMWLVLSEQLNFDVEFVQVPEGYGTFVDGVWTGMIGALANGSIDATVGFISFSSERYDVIQYSVPLTQWDNGFVIQRSIEPELQLQPHGYNRSILLLIAAFLAVVSLFEWHRLSTVSDAVWSALSALCFQLPSNSCVLRNPLMILGWLGVVVGYFAGFRSQAITSGFVSAPFQTMSEAQRKFGSGTLTLLISHISINADLVYPTPKSAQLHPPLVVSDELATQLLCTRRNLIYFGDTGVLGSIWQEPSPCHIQRIPVSDRAFGMGSLYLAIGFRKKFPLYQAANDILMRIFPIDQIEGYWANKYNRQFPLHGFTNDRCFLPISLSALMHAYYLLLAGFCLASLVSYCERQLYIFQMNRRLSRC